MEYLCYNYIFSYNYISWGKEDFTLLVDRNKKSIV